ncbi:unnamed protein product [Moneuplotes crassus]|uniref:LITAF domain-containing protein n=1 Tax=Euplotes crassus TaxID=5936 RepID=A0AAD1XWU6_EUPCR|nr:unnamed protein product [Moneuplotes crassus]
MKTAPKVVIGEPVQVNPSNANHFGGGRPGQYNNSTNLYPSQGYGGSSGAYGAGPMGPPAPASYDPYAPQQHYVPPPSCYGMNKPIPIKCPNCGHGDSLRYTKTKISISPTQWILFIILYLFFPMCCCAPCYVPSCYRVTHTCGECNYFIGISQ